MCFFLLFSKFLLNIYTDKRRIFSSVNYYRNWPGKTLFLTKSRVVSYNMENIAFRIREVITMREVHISTLHKLLEFLKATGHNLVAEVEEIPSLKSFWEQMFDEIPELITDL